MPPGRTVFVGNIPYGLSEEILRETLGRVGTVVSWRLVLDKETGKPKGFGFAEYLDHDSASSAVRNLNDTEFMGRKLRVDWSNDGDRTANATGEMSMNGVQTGTVGATDGQAQAGGLPEIPPGTELPAGVSAPDQISKTLMTLPPPQLLDIISQMKGLVMSDPAQASAILRAQPQFAFAIFQALLVLELVDQTQLATILAETATASQPVAPTQVQTQAQIPQMPPQPPQPATQPIPQHNYPLQYGQVQQPQYAAPPTIAPTYQQPLPQQFQAPPQQSQPVAPPAPTPEQMVYIQQIMSLPQHRIDMLPPDQREQVLLLRGQYAAQGF